MFARAAFVIFLSQDFIVLRTECAVRACVFMFTYLDYTFFIYLFIFFFCGEIVYGFV